jgi:hypothetical protein
MDKRKEFACDEFTEVLNEGLAPHRVNVLDLKMMTQLPCRPGLTFVLMGLLMENFPAPDGEDYPRFAIIMMPLQYTQPGDGGYVQFGEPLPVAGHDEWECAREEWMKFSNEDVAVVAVSRVSL